MNNYQITFTGYDDNGDSKFRIQENINGKFGPSINITLSRYELQGLPWDEVVDLIISHLNQSDFNSETTESMETIPQSSTQGNQLTNLGQKLGQVIIKYWMRILGALFLTFTIPMLISGADQRQKLQDEITKLRQERETKYLQCTNTCMQEREVYDAQVTVLKKKLQAE